MVTVKDIAKEANVSHTAVSAVLNGREKEARIGNATAELIRKIAADMKYSPNMIARGLRTGRSNSIGILLPVPEDNIFSGLLKQLQSRLYERGYFGVYSFWNSYDGMKEAAETVLQRNVDGIITVAPNAVPDSCNVPVVSFLDECKSGKYDFVGLDRDFLSAMVVEYLYSLGHRKIAKPDCPATVKARKVNNFFAKCLKKYGLSSGWMWDCFDKNGLYSESLKDASVRIVDRIISSAERPTAIVMPNDLSAIAFMAEATRRGLRIPEDISVIGGDNICMGEFTTPRLTSVAFDREDSTLADCLIDVMLERIESPEMPRKKILIQGRLVIRNSCSNIEEK